MKVELISSGFVCICLDRQWTLECKTTCKLKIVGTGKYDQRNYDLVPLFTKEGERILLMMHNYPDFGMRKWCDMMCSRSRDSTRLFYIN